MAWSDGPAPRALASQRAGSLESPLAPRKTRALREAEHTGRMYRVAIDAQRRRVQALEAELARAHGALASGSARASDRRVRAAVLAASRSAGARGASSGSDDAVAEEELGSLARVCGLVFTQSTSELLAPVDGVRLRRYALAGTSHQVPFSLEFDVNERLLRIVRLAASLPEAMADELAGLRERAEAACSVRLFFRGLSDYARLHKRRRTTMRLLKHEFGDALVLPHGAFASSVLVAHSPETPPLLSLVISWRLSFDERGRVSESVDLLPQPSTDVAAVALASALHGLPDRMRDMLDSFGIEATLRCVIASVASALQASE